MSATSYRRFIEVEILRRVFTGQEGCDRKILVANSFLVVSLETYMTDSDVVMIKSPKHEKITL